MTEYLTDYTEYETFTAQHPNGHVLQSHLWAAQKPDWHWQAIVSRDESGSIQGSIAILTRKLPFLPLTIAYGSRGPICPPDRADILEELLLAAGQYAKSQHAVFLRLDPDVPAANRTYAAQLQAMGFFPKSAEYCDQFQPKYIYRLFLQNQTEDDLLSSFHAKTRYNIRLARRRGVTVRVGGLEDVPVFSALMEETGARDGFRIRPAAILHLCCKISDHMHGYILQNMKAARWLVPLLYNTVERSGISTVHLPIVTGIKCQTICCNGR